MFFSFRSKLFALSVLLIAGFILITGIYLHQALGGWTKAQIESELEARTLITAAALESLDSRAEDLQLLEQLSGERLQRITLIGPDGAVVFDSELSAEQVQAIESHLDRPEVQAALGGDFGRATRKSSVTGEEMLYGATAFGDGSVIRLSMPLSEVYEVLARLRFLLFIGSLFGLGVAIFMSSFASSLMSRTLQDVLARSRDEAPTAPRSLNEVTRELEETLDTLATERDRFRRVLEGMSEGIIATDKDLQVTMSNDAARQLLLPEAENLAGLSLQDLIPEEVLLELVEEAEFAESASAEFTLPADDPALPPRQIHCRMRAPQNSEGPILVVHDMTKLRRLERVRRDFVANVSHELRTPVAIIQANSETLIDGAMDSPEHARAFILSIHRNAERLSRLIADLLDISRMEAGKRKFRLEPVPLKAAVDRASAAAARLANNGGPELRVHIPNDLTVQADPGALDQVLVNLIDNAAKYTPDEGFVELRAHKTQDRILLEVLDNGPGIDLEHQDRIFERFYRVDQGRSSQLGGSGLGLSIVRHLVVSMDGDVGYRQPDEGGSLFWFTLPSAP